MNKEIPQNSLPQIDTSVPRLLLAATEPLENELETLRIARALCESGYEVIYIGCGLTPEQIYSAVIQENVDLIGLNLISGENDGPFEQVVQVLRKREVEGIILMRNVFSNSEYFSGLGKQMSPVLSDTHFAMSA